MDIRDYLKVLVKRWWIIGLVCVIAAGVAFAYSKSQPRMYRASVQLAVKPSRLDYGNVMSLQNQLRSLAKEIHTRRLAETVISDLEKSGKPVDMAPDVLLGKLTVAAINEDLAIRLDFDDLDPGRARDVVNAWAQAYVDYNQAQIARITQGDFLSASILDKAEAPAAPFRPRTKLNTLAGALLGLLLGAVLAFVLEYIDDSIKSGEDVERYVGLTTVGSIPTISTTRATPRKRVVGT